MRKIGIRVSKTLGENSRLKSFFVIAVIAMAMIPTLPAQPVSADVGPITLTKFVCPDDFDATGKELAEIQAQCTDAGVGFPFSLNPDGGNPVDMNTDNSGAINFGNIDPGTGSISEVAAENNASRVFCSVYDQGGSPNFYEEFDATSNIIGYDLADTKAIDCLWYNFTPQIDYSEVQIQKYVCPQDFDGDTATLDDFDTGCTDVGAGFPFALLPDGESPQEQQADNGGHIIWTPITPGHGIVTETAAENNASRVFCSVYDLDEVIQANYQEVDATSNQIEYDVDAGFGLDCRWFNYGFVTGGSAVTISKLACPEGDWHQSTFDDLTQNCTAPHGGVPFEIISDIYAQPPSLTGDNGQISWNVPAATYTINEIVPPGYGDARVFCSSFEQGQGPGEYTETDANGNSIELIVEDGFDSDCFWFNFLAEGGTIEVNKFLCPENYTPAGTFDQIQSDCDTPYADITFTLTPAGEDGIEDQTDASGQLIFPDVPLGEGTVDETVPDGIGLVVVYCAVSDDTAQGDYQKMSITPQNSMGYLMEPTQAWTCSWFNIPAAAGPASLTINKFTCDALHDAIDPNQTLVNECNLGTQDITFTLEAAGSTLSASTGEGGKPATIQFTDLEPGTYRLTEQIPDNVRLAYISQCRSDVRSFSYPFSPFAIIEPEGRINIELLPGEDLECDWYNILAPEGGSVTITKYWCPDEPVNKANCELYTEGIGFTLSPVGGGEDIEFETGPDGTATVDAQGTYDLTENDFEWCFAESDAVNGEGQVVVDPGQDVEVSIYNCGPQPLQGGS